MRWIALIALLLGTVSCDRPPPPQVQIPVQIIATSYVLADVARQVVGEDGKVDWLVDLGDQVEDAILSEGERRRLNGAQVIFCDGSRSEPWADEGLDSDEQRGRRVALESLPTGQATQSSGLLWLNPKAMKEGARELAVRTGGWRPAKGDQFLARAEAYGKKLDELAAYTPDLSRSSPVIILDHRWETLLTTVGARFARVDVDPLNLDQEGIARIKRLAAAWRTEYLILPIDTPPARQQYIMEVTKLKIVQLDHLGHQSLPGHTSYIDVIRYDYDELRKLPPAPDFVPPQEKRPSRANP